MVFSVFAACVATQRVETWSRSGRTSQTPEAVVDALALSYVGQRVTENGTFEETRLASDFGGAPTIVAYYSLDSEESAISLRDISWLSERFGARGLHVVAISVDGPERLADVRKEIAWRRYPYEWVMDTPEHAERISHSREMPMGFLVLGGRIMRRSFGIVQDQGRTIWGGMRVQFQLDELLPKLVER